MNLDSVYIMVDDGRCIFYYPLTSISPPPQLVTGMLSALQIFILEITGEYPDTLTAGGFSFNLFRSGPITIVIASSSEITINNELYELSLRFISRYGNDLRVWKGKLDTFKEFKDDVDNILGIKTQVDKIIPKNPINGFLLLSLEEELIEVAKVIIQIKEGTSEQISKILKNSLYQTQLKLEKLVTMGHIGRVLQLDKILYFT